MQTLCRCRNPFATFKETDYLLRHIFFTVVPCILLLLKFLLPTDAQENCFQRGIKICIKTAPACFGVITIIRERTI